MGLGFLTTVCDGILLCNSGPVGQATPKRGIAGMGPPRWAFVLLYTAMNFLKVLQKTD